MTPAKASFTPSLTRAPRLENGLGGKANLGDRTRIGACPPQPVIPRRAITIAGFDPNRKGYQFSMIGYLAKICSIRLKALSAAACGVTAPCMISAQPTCQTC